MIPVKRRRVSYLSPTELTLVLLALDKFQRSIEVVEVDIDEGAEGPDDILLSDLDSIISKLRSWLDKSQNDDFPGAEERILGNLKIECTGDLMLKRDYEKIISVHVEAGNNQLWSSKAMHMHLAMLENSVQAQDEVGASLWIDTFFFPKPGLSANWSKEFAHYIHWIHLLHYFFITEREIAPFYLEQAEITSAKALKTGFFVIEAKEMGVSLSDHLPQALCELYECAVQLEQPIIRGALTNGRKWIFIILYINENGLGARYKTSEDVEYDIIHVRKPGGKEKEIVGTEPDLIASVILHWAQSSFTDIGEDDLFYEFSSGRK